MKHRRRGRFGEIAVQKGFLSPERLEEALADQATARARGEVVKPIGEMLLDQGAMTEEQVLTILQEVIGVAGELTEPSGRADLGEGSSVEGDDP